MQRFNFCATESAHCSPILDEVLLSVLMMKDFSNCGIWTQDTNIKMQRPIFWATESVEHNLLLDEVLLRVLF